MSLPKTNARKCAVQALYQWQMSGISPYDIEEFFHQDDKLKGAQNSYFAVVLYGVVEQQKRIDKVLMEFIDRPVDKIDPVERAILRIGVFELFNRVEIPYRVIINEAVDLAKCFGAEGSYRYVNGILDKASQKIRNAEIKSKPEVSQSAG